MGYAQTFARLLSDNYSRGAREVLAHRPRSACGSRRSVAVVPLIGDKRYYGETPMRLRGDCRPMSGNGPGGWRRGRAPRLAFWGSYLGRSSQPILRQPAKEQGRVEGRLGALRTTVTQNLICAPHHAPSF